MVNETAAPSLAQIIFFIFLFFSKQLKKVFSKLSGTPEKNQFFFFYSNNPRKILDLTFIFI